MEEEYIEYGGLIKLDKESKSRRGVSTKTLCADLEDTGLNEEIIAEAVELYRLIAADRTFQKHKRKGLAFACVLQVHKLLSIPLDLSKMMKAMGIDDGVASKGLRLYNEQLASLGLPLSPLEADAPEYAYMFLMSLYADDTWYVEPNVHVSHNTLRHAKHCVASILDWIKSGKLLRLKSSTPRCLAAGVIYFHFIASSVKVIGARYSKIVECSMVSVEKVHKDIAMEMKNLTQ
jgi:transcription initiation factor TFIIIB Brf1 subunit/transcription initiation factor TFIIB